MSKLDKEEKEILAAFDSGRLKRSKGSKKDIANHKSYAEATFKKDARINIRLSSRDLRALQTRALQEGIPYQTLVASVLHKYVDGQFKETGT
jgi:predicted DNA binding CopG/RHH family protein